MAKDAQEITIEEVDLWRSNYCHKEDLPYADWLISRVKELEEQRLHSIRMCAEIAGRYWQSGRDVVRNEIRKKFPEEF